MPAMKVVTMTRSRSGGNFRQKRMERFAVMLLC